MNIQNIYNILHATLANNFAVFGIMGNLKDESALNSINLQNTANTKLSMTDEQYTEAVDSGKYTNFVRDGYGYGLAQWTYWSRKELLLEFARAKNCSIGDETMQCEFILQELQKNYKTLYSKLLRANSIQEASDLICTVYEKPADQSYTTLTRRAAFGNELYEILCCQTSETSSNFLKELDNLLYKYGYRRA